MVASAGKLPVSLGLFIHILVVLSQDQAQIDMHQVIRINYLIVECALTQQTAF